MGLKREDPGPMPAGDVKSNLKITYLPVIEQGLRNLEKALAINPQYDDAMAYRQRQRRHKWEFMEAAVAVATAFPRNASG
ncbi:Tetratricopeptide TPR_2 repeat protein (fragment) [Candidatus Sulfopaludibacter sp. SbA3]